MAKDRPSFTVLEMPVSFHSSKVNFLNSEKGYSMLSFSDEKTMLSSEKLTFGLSFSAKWIGLPVLGYTHSASSAAALSLCHRDRLKNAIKKNLFLYLLNLPPPQFIRRANDNVVHWLYYLEIYVGFLSLYSPIDLRFAQLHSRVYVFYPECRRQKKLFHL